MSFFPVAEKCEEVTRRGDDMANSMSGRHMTKFLLEREPDDL
jgi:hypothetical protein